MAPSPSGKRIELRRTIGLWSVVLVIVANMVGTGIFTTSGYTIQSLGDSWLLLGVWLLGGVIALAGALSYAELGARLPHAGGEYVFLRQSFGPLAAFLSGWVSLVVGFSAPIAASAQASAAYMLQAWPGALPNLGFSFGGLTVGTEGVLALVFIAAMTMVHTARTGWGVSVQNVLTVAKLLVLCVIIITGLALWPYDGPWSPAAPAGGGLESLWAPLAVALVFVSFAYSGFNAAAYLGEEVADPGRNLPRAIIIGTGSVVLLYLLLNLAFLASVGPEKMSGVKEVGALAAKALWGPGVGGVFSLIMGLCLLSSLGAMILAGPRVYFAMARDGVFPRTLAQVGGKSGVPANAVLLQSIIAALLVITTTFGQLLFYIGFTLSLFAALTVAGLFILRRRDGADIPFRVPGYPITPLLFIASNLWMVVFSLADNPWRGLPALITILVGLAVYGYFRRWSPQDHGNP